ncbi:MAG: DUF799 family lipoprotein [Deltaproteobacteria bacterium]|nr:DUF799 family lipoprotein [Deltaproteobacteria bacterium]
MTFKKFSSSVLLILTAILLASCGLPAIKVTKNPYNPVRSIAVLPLYNATNDVDGPKVIRELVDGRLRNYHYNVKPLKEVDETLRDKFGITLGSQLELTTPEKLGEELGVDAVLYGYLLNFETLTTIVYNVKKVRAAFRLVDVKTGKTVWTGAKGVRAAVSMGGRNKGGAAVEALGESLDKDAGGDIFKTIPGLADIPGVNDWKKTQSRYQKSAADAAILSLGEQLVTTAFRVYLRMESDEMLNIIMSSFPAGPL